MRLRVLLLGLQGTGPPGPHLPAADWGGGVTDFSSKCPQKFFGKFQEDFGRREIWQLMKQL